MPVWRCPHCATPQQEASRCWVCRRSTTSCATCRHYRRGVAGGLGLCGQDPKHRPLDGTEMRACWTSMPRAPEPDERPLIAVGPGRGIGRDDHAGPGAAPRPRTFVLVETLTAPSDETQAAGTTESAVTHAAAISPAPGTPGRIPGTWWLWGDPEPWPDL